MEVDTSRHAALTEQLFVQMSMLKGCQEVQLLHLQSKLDVCQAIANKPIGRICA